MGATAATAPWASIASGPGNAVVSLPGRSVQSRRLAAARLAALPDTVRRRAAFPFRHGVHAGLRRFAPTSARETTSAWSLWTSPPPTPPLAGDLWWKTAVIYCLDVQTFYDSNGDGIGDFAGLSERLDHLVDLGVTVVWLMPFYPTADVDDGYDITDFYTVDPRLGTLGDFVEFVRTARSRGLRVIADLVVNHTSADHPWFQSARSSRDSPYRDWYVWRDEPGPGKPRRRRVSRPGDQHLDQGPQGRAVLPAPLLPQPAGPERHQSRGPRRDRPHHRLLDGAGSVRFPGRRRSLPAGNHRHRAAAPRRCRSRTTTCAICAPSSAGAAATPSCSARSICRTNRPARSSATRTATS